MQEEENTWRRPSAVHPHCPPAHAPAPCCAALRCPQVLNAGAALFMARRMVETKRRSLADIRALLVGQ